MLRSSSFQTLNECDETMLDQNLKTETSHEVPPEKPWRSEFKALLLLGIPMGLTQLVQFSVQTIDVLMIGRLGPEALAASSLGLVLFFAVWLAFFGPAMAVSPMVSQALGADRNDKTSSRRSVRMGLWSIGLGFPFAVILFVFAPEIAIALGQEEELARMAGPYVLALGPGLPFAMGILVLRNFLAAIDKTRVPLFVVIFTTLLNAFFNWLLIYGNWGVPRLELIGAGIASSLVHMCGFFLLVGYIKWDREARRFDLFENWWRPDWPRLKEVMQLGWPIGVTMAFEGMLFNVSVFLMGIIGVIEMAAYQVALNVAALAFMMPLGFSMAGSVRVGLAAGARNLQGVRRAAGATIVLCIAAIMCFAVPVLLLPDWVASLYLDAEDSNNAEVLALVASFLVIAAAFMLSDAIQVAANQCLRGLKDVRIPMILTGISYWAIGFPLAAWLGLGSPLGAVGIWWGLLASLVAASILLGGRLWWITYRRTDIALSPQESELEHV